MISIAGYKIYDDESSPLRAHFESPGTRIPNWVIALKMAFLSAIQYMAARRRQQRTLRALSELEDWQLKDIGHPELYSQRRHDKFKLK